VDEGEYIFKFKLEGYCDIFQRLDETLTHIYSYISIYMHILQFYSNILN
jgi:hypothetical protein